MAMTKEAVKAMKRNPEPRLGLKEISRARGENRYLEAMRREALEMYEASLPEYRTKVATARHVCELLNIGCAETLLSWVRQSEINAGRRA
jgi:hypothetical protein